jgi:hypothetical protein
LSAVLLKLLSARNYWFEWAFQTSSGKSNGLKLCASVFGDPSQEYGLLLNWRLTRAALEEIVAMRSDLPTFLDESKLANPDDAAQIIYDLAQGRGRERANRQGGLRAAAQFRTVALTCGEEPLSAFSKDGGVVARVISAQKPPWGAVDAATAALVDAIDGLVSENYGHVAPVFIERVAAEYYADGGMGLRAEHERYRKAWVAKAGNCGPAIRMASNFAIMQVSARIFHEALELTGDPLPALAAVWAVTNPTLPDADRAAEALRAVYGWAVANPARMYAGPEAHQPFAGWAGVWRQSAWDEIAFIPEELNKILKELGYLRPEGVLNIWKERGWIKQEEQPGRNPRNPQRMLGRERPRCVCICRHAIESVGEVDPLPEPLEAPAAAQPPPSPLFVPRFGSGDG